MRGSEVALEEEERAQASEEGEKAQASEEGEKAQAERMARAEPLKQRKTKRTAFAS